MLTLASADNGGALTSRNCETGNTVGSLTEAQEALRITVGSVGRLAELVQPYLLSMFGYKLPS